MIAKRKPKPTKPKAAVKPIKKPAGNPYNGGDKYDAYIVLTEEEKKKAAAARGKKQPPAPAFKIPKDKYDSSPGGSVATPAQKKAARIRRMKY
jgi:hypothetical protein